MEVSLERRTMCPIYWPAPPKALLRGSWFVEPVPGKGWAPLPHPVSQALETRYQERCVVHLCRCVVRRCISWMVWCPSNSYFTGREKQLAHKLLVSEKEGAKACIPGDCHVKERARSCCALAAYARAMTVIHALCDAGATTSGRRAQQGWSTCSSLKASMLSKLTWQASSRKRITPSLSAAHQCGCARARGSGLAGAVHLACGCSAAMWKAWIRRCGILCWRFI